MHVDIIKPLFFTFPYKATCNFGHVAHPCGRGLYALPSVFLSTQSRPPVRLIILWLLFTECFSGKPCSEGTFVSGQKCFLKYKCWSRCIDAFEVTGVKKGYTVVSVCLSQVDIMLNVCVGVFLCVIFLTPVCLHEVTFVFSSGNAKGIFSIFVVTVASFISMGLVHRRACGCTHRLARLWFVLWFTVGEEVCGECVDLVIMFCGA